MEYYSFAGGDGSVEYVRIDRATAGAEYFDVYEHAWLRLDAFYDQIVFKGEGGDPIPEATVLAATRRIAVA
jgi:hypothetical protein